ncbi:MAG TPA: TetR/AcrR family transcriptional regulator [Bacillota bacterium]|nr:TetR/AcrR family transcriptional regulator [Bacillota bacterium]
MTVIPFSSAFKGRKGDGDKHTLKTAAGMFAKKGYYRTTVDEIARALGVAKGTIYYHFKNKEELYLAVIQEGINLLEERLRQAASGSVSRREKVERMIGSLLAFIEREKDLVFLFLKELCGSDLQREVLAKMLSGCLLIIRNVIEEGMEDGTFREIDPETAARSLFGMTTISALHYISYSRSIPHDKVRGTIEQIFFRGSANPDF